MERTQAQINPSLIALLNGQIAEQPTVDMLPGEYAEVIFNHKHKIEQKYPVNIQALHCNACGQAGDYNAGLVFMPPDNWKRYERDSNGKMDKVDMIDYIQTTGYVRCEHCNHAGDWSSASASFTLDIMSGLVQGGSMPNSLYSFAAYAMFDGTQPKWASDGEEHLLDKLQLESSDAFVWID